MHCYSVSYGACEHKMHADLCFEVKQILFTPEFHHIIWRKKVLLQTENDSPVRKFVAWLNEIRARIGPDSGHKAAFKARTERDNHFITLVRFNLTLVSLDYRR